jgi:protein TonB
MTVISYEQLALNWSPDSKRDHVFNMIAFIVLVGFLILGLVVSSISVPKIKHNARVLVPERVAKFITEKPKPKPKVQPQPVPKPLPIPSPLVRHKKPKQKKPLTKLEKKARKKASESGLLALTSQLSDLMDTKSVDKMVGGKIHNAKNVNKAATINANVLTANSGTGSAVVRQNVYSAGATQGTRLDDNQLKLAKKLLASHGQIQIVDKHKSNQSNASRIRGDNVRAEEDVAYVMDKHKSVLHSLYRRARRAHPGLKGKIVLELTILPSGKVSRVRIVSSELKDATLEQRLVERIKLFDFGARPVETLTVTIPVEFLPS